MLFDPLTFKQRTVVADKAYVNSTAGSSSVNLNAQNQNYSNTTNHFATKIQHYIYPQFYSRLIDSTSAAQLVQNSNQIANQVDKEPEVQHSNTNDYSDESGSNFASKRIRSKLSGTQIKEVWKEISNQKRAGNETLKHDDENVSQQKQAVITLSSGNLTSTPRNLSDPVAHRITFSDDKSNLGVNPHTKAKYHLLSPNSSNDFGKINHKNLTTSQIHTINSVKHFSTKNNNGSITLSTSNNNNNIENGNRRTPENRVNLNRNLTFRIRPTEQSSPLGGADLRRTHSALPILLRSANGTASIISVRQKNSKPAISINSPQGHYVTTSKNVQDLEKLDLNESKRAYLL